jgi:hypothetical protein
LKEKIDTHNRIIIHTPRLFNSTVCFFIGTLNRIYPNVEISVHLYPHNISSLKYKKIKIKEKIRQKIKKYFYKIFGLHFYDDFHDIRGLSSPITKKIYVVPGTEENIKKYHNNIAIIPFGGVEINKKNTKNSILVIGQANITEKYLSREIEKKATKRILEIKNDNKINNVDYLPHPRKTNLELYDDSFNLVKTEYCAEVLALDEMYEIIISFNSTGLLYTKMLLGDTNVRVISIGINQSELYEELESTKKVMNSIGIEIINV